MRIQVYWKDKLLYEADAEKDYQYYVPFFSSVARQSIKLEDRMAQLNKVANDFILEVLNKPNHSFTNLQDVKVYIIFPSRANSWTRKEIDEKGNDYPGKIKK